MTSRRHSRGMGGQLSTDQVFGIVFLVLGILALVGYFSGIIILVAGIAAIVLGILILMGKRSGSTLLGAISLALGIVLVAVRIPFLDDVARLLTIVVGVILVVVGTLKLTGRW